MRSVLQEGIDQAEDNMAQLRELGIDFDAIARKLQEDGVAAFAASYDKLLTALNGKRQRIAA